MFTTGVWLTGRPIENVLATLGQQGRVEIVNDERFGTPVPADSPEADRLLRRLQVKCHCTDGKTDEYTFDVNGRGIVMSCTAQLH